MTQTNNAFETDDGKWDGVIRAFWRRIQGYKKCEFNDVKDLPDPLPVEFRAHFATALLNAPKELRDMAQNEQKEPFGYFKAEPFGWTDCAETDEGAIALYDSPPKQAIPDGWIGMKKDAERYRWLRKVSRDPDESSPYCVITEEILEKGKPAKMVSYLKFDEKLDDAIDKAMINEAPTNTEVGK